MVKLKTTQTGKRNTKKNLKYNKQKTKTIIKINVLNDKNEILTTIQKTTIKTTYGNQMETTTTKRMENYVGKLNIIFKN